MKLPSLGQLSETGIATLRRFPYVALCALLACSISIFIAENHDQQVPGILKLLMTFALGIPLFTAVGLFSERAGWQPKQDLALRIGAWLFLGAYYLIGQADVTTNYYMRYAQLSLAFHLIVSFAPFLLVDQVQGFWQFNRRLFLRFCLSFLYASVFYGGLALALGSLDFLFDVKLHGELFADLWFVSVFLLQTIHFLAGVPKVTDGLDQDLAYPFGLKIFTQYLLLPLVALYTFILYAYFVKIGITQNWPKGFVSWLVVGQSVFGIFCLLLLHPLAEDKSQAWIGRVTRGFYMAIPALLIMLFIAVGKRLAQYDLSEKRYLVVILGLWLLGICLYFARRSSRNIKLIPMSLAALALITSCGPWGAYQWARRSQQGRFEAVLEKDHLLLNGKFQKAGAMPSQDDQNEIFASLDYLTETHGVEGLRQWLSDAQLAELEKDDIGRSYDIFDVRFANSAAKVAKMLGLNYVEAYSRNKGTKNQYRYYYIKEHDENGSGRPLLNISGYDWMLPIVARHELKKKPSQAIWDYLNLDSKAMEFYQGDKLMTSIPLQDFLAKIAALPQGGVPTEDMTYESSDGGNGFKVMLDNLGVDASGDSLNFKVNSVSGWVLLRLGH